MIKATKKCLTCKRELLWTKFTPVWGGSLQASYLRRSCQDCLPPEDKSPQPAEIGQMQKELRRLTASRLKLEEQLKNLCELIDERSLQLQTALNGGGTPPNEDEGGLL